ncbi:MAG: ferrous iron transport protein A [Corallococcus sp.]|nr:ferrous iron transport protein A [Corallococcus sp.]
MRVAVDEKVKRHLENLGIIAGNNLVVLSQANGSVIVKIKDERLALNRSLAMNIFVNS